MAASGAVVALDLISITMSAATLYAVRPSWVTVTGLARALPRFRAGLSPLTGSRPRAAALCAVAAVVAAVLGLGAVASNVAPSSAAHAGGERFASADLSRPAPVLAAPVARRLPRRTAGAPHAAAGARRPSRTARTAVRKALTYARAQLGKPYVYGGQGPRSFDCSGLTMMAYRAAGIRIPRTADVQYWHTRHLRRGSEQAGDLVFFEPGHSGPGHVGIVVDPARHLMIAAPHTGTVVKVQSYRAVAAADGLVGFSRPARGAIGRTPRFALSIGRGATRVSVPHRRVRYATARSARRHVRTSRTAFRRHTRRTPLPVHPRTRRRPAGTARHPVRRPVTRPSPVRRGTGPGHVRRHPIPPMKGGVTGTTPDGRAVGAARAAHRSSPGRRCPFGASRPAGSPGCSGPVLASPAAQGAPRRPVVPVAHRPGTGARAAARIASAPRGPAARVPGHGGEIG